MAQKAAGTPLIASEDSSYHGHVSVNFNLYYVARSAVERVQADRQNAMVAVVFSALWLESFVNEAVELPHVRPNFQNYFSKKVLTLAGAFKELGDRLALVTKVQLMAVMLKGEKLDAGSRQLQDFVTLIDLRNAMVHLRIGRFDKLENRDGFTVRGQKTLTKRLRDRDLISKDDVTGLGWYEALFQPAIAVWALDTAYHTAEMVADLFPRGGYRTELHSRVVGSPTFIRQNTRTRPVRPPEE